MPQVTPEKYFSNNTHVTGKRAYFFWSPETETGFGLFLGRQCDMKEQRPVAVIAINECRSLHTNPHSPCLRSRTISMRGARSSNRQKRAFPAKLLW